VALTVAQRTDSPRRAFWLCAGLALLVHLSLYARAGGLHGGGDLLPHLRLIQLMGESPALRNIYPPAYHVLGALLTPVVGLSAYPSVFAFLSAIGLLLAFRFFQRATALPDESAALFALLPYPLALSWCVPKIQFAGLALMLFGLGLLARRRYAFAATALAATFYVHTAAALVFGLLGVVLTIGRRDRRGVAALACGTLLATPLFVAHLEDGCSWAQALLLTPSGFLGWGRAGIFDGVQWVILLASPLALVTAGIGSSDLWRRHRQLIWICLALVVLWTSPIWLAPFGVRSAVDLMRGLSLASIALAIPGGLALVGRPRLRVAVLAISALWLMGCAAWAVPSACFTRSIALDELDQLEVARCRFVWRRPAARSAGPLDSRALPQRGGR
jgi:hypothetical protein